MGANQFKPFGTGVGALTLAPAAYAALAVVQQGFQNGLADAQQFNTFARQVSSVGAMLGQFVANRSGDDANDDGNITALLASFEKALIAIAQPLGVYFLTDTGTADAMVATSTPAPSAYSDVRLIVVKKMNAPNAGAMTANFWGKGAVALKDNTGAALSGGALIGNGYYVLTYDGSQFRALGGAATYTSVTSLTANSGDAIEVTGGGLVNLRTGRGSASAGVRNANDKFPFGRAADDHAMYDTRADFLTWLASALAFPDVVHDTTLTGTGKVGAPLLVPAACRAWGMVRSNVLVAGYNIASLVAGGGGAYTINFSAAMPHANFSVVATNAGGPNWAHETPATRTTTQCHVECWNIGFIGVAAGGDADFNFAIFC